jgi:nucleotide-binding universal stress UspA family protein
MESRLQFDADLIIVGARGLSTLMALLEGSVTYDLIHHRRRPVLAVP